jgi:hypothetical protein
MAERTLRRLVQQKAKIQIVWDAIALHTTIGVAQYKEPEVALVYSGVGYDVMGEHFERLTEEEREQVVSAFPAMGSSTRFCRSGYQLFIPLAVFPSSSRSVSPLSCAFSCTG